MFDILPFCFASIHIKPSSRAQSLKEKTSVKEHKLLTVHVCRGGELRARQKHQKRFGIPHFRESSHSRSSPRPPTTLICDRGLFFFRSVIVAGFPPTGQQVQKPPSTNQLQPETALTNSCRLTFHFPSHTHTYTRTHTHIVVCSVRVQVKS